MEKTRTDLTKWFLAIYLIAHDKRGISAQKLSQDIEVTYKTAWLMLHKIRHAMKNRDASYRIGGIVEVDDATFGTPTEGGKRGRGTDKTKVLIGLSLSDEGHPLFLKMAVIPDIKGKTLQKQAKNWFEKGATISSDTYSSYRTLPDAGFSHDYQLYDPSENPDHLKWLHTVISNAKAFIAGTFHGLDKQHFQNYLDEFCYLFNRRQFNGQWFDRLATLCATSETIICSELRG